MALQLSAYWQWKVRLTFILKFELKINQAAPGHEQRPGQTGPDSHERFKNLMGPCHAQIPSCRAGLSMSRDPCAVQQLIQN